MPKLTKRLIGDLPTDAPTVIWDTELPGFGIRYQGGAWRYVLKFRAHGRQRWTTIGRHGAPWAPDSARDEARRLLGLVVTGKDPAEARDAARAIPTLAAFADRYVHEYAAVHKKPRSVAEDRGNLRRAILPTLGRLRLDRVSRADVVRFHLSRQDHPVNANRCLALLSHMFNMAEKWGLRPDGSNPCRHVERFRERKRERFLSEAEMARLGNALAEVEAGRLVWPYAVAAVRLLIFTGARMSEVLTLRWQHVDFGRGVLRLPDSKTREKTIYLSAPALELLANLLRIQGNPYVIVGGKPGAHLSDLEAPWRTIRAHAGLQDVRLHDLRHSFASVAVDGGASLPVIGALLGHTQIATTQRYAHLSANPLRAATDAVGARIVAAMTGTDGGAACLMRFSK